MINKYHTFLFLLTEKTLISFIYYFDINNERRANIMSEFALYTIGYIRNKLYENNSLSTGYYSPDSRNYSFFTNKQNSRFINIYQITSQKDLDECVNRIKNDLIRSV